MLEPVPAHAPQAKGRIERLVPSVQARVSNEMRRAGVATLDAANQYVAADRHRPGPARRARACDQMHDPLRATHVRWSALEGTLRITTTALILP